MEAESLSLNDLGTIIQEDWKKPYFGAVPYIQAMREISNGMYGLDSWNSVVAYFLANAQTWRGDVARTVKKELKKRLKQKTP